jgi:hypothetical protein
MSQIRQGDASATRWLPVVGYEGRYEVSDAGGVRTAAGVALKPRIDRAGYVRAVLYSGSRASRREHLVHRLVCRAFHGPAPVGRPDVNHLNGVKADNSAANLEWSNDSLNVTHAFRVLGVPHAVTRPWLGKFGDNNPRSKAVLRFGGAGPELRYESISLVERDGFCFKRVSAVCNGKRRTHGGYQWRFEHDIRVAQHDSEFLARWAFPFPIARPEGASAAMAINGALIEDQPMKNPLILRQGDVSLVQVDQLPAGCVPVAGQEKKIVLAWGEVTGHHHRIEDHVVPADHRVRRQLQPGAAAEIAEAAIARAKARLLVAPNGERFLEVTEPVSLKHEEHTAHAIPPGIYQLPTQVEYTPSELRRVED